MNFNDVNYDKYATPREKEILEVLRSEQQQQKAADKLGVSRSRIKGVVKRVKAKAIASGYIPENGMNEPFNESLAHQKSTVHVKDGKVVQYWARLKPEFEEQIKRIETAISGFIEPLPKLPNSTFKRPDYNTDIIPWFQIGDAHIGMLAHADEVGHNFDLKIAEAELCLAIDRLIDAVEPCERCVINDLGDYSHYENYSGTTEASGHALDFDTRYHKMIKVYGRTYRYIIEKALTRFKYVDLIVNQGNHSRTNDLQAVMWLDMLYEGNDRVTILNNASVFIPYRMGNTFVMTHHSDQCKPPKLADVMATDFKHDHGETAFHYVDIGHIHHKSVTHELGNCIVSSWNQIAPSDKYAHDHGWRSRSFLTVVKRSKTYGNRGTEEITREEVQDCINQAVPGTAANHRRKVYTV